VRRVRLNMFVYMLIPEHRPLITIIGSLCLGLKHDTLYRCSQALIHWVFSSQLISWPVYPRLWCARLDVSYTAKSFYSLDPQFRKRVILMQMYNDPVRMVGNEVVIHM
jgi:hypothetical protein